jgi:hypothetical protein
MRKNELILSTRSEVGGERKKERKNRASVACVYVK